VLVDDGSLDDTQAKALGFTPTAPNVRVAVIALPRTMGHQEAIYQGLSYASHSSAQRFIVMDADGEDDAEAIMELATIRDASVVFVARGKRSESFGFQLGYRLYRLLFRLVAGRSISFGNYSIIDRSVLAAVLDRSFVHYAAFLSKRPVPSQVIVRDRRPRLDGRSKMGYKDLAAHALRSLVEYGDEAQRLLLNCFLYLALGLLLLVLGVYALKKLADMEVPAWITNASSILLLTLMSCVGLFALGLWVARKTFRQEPGAHRSYRVVEERAS
jgi:glycosyltransferase involved in cell wall biosynthesis